MWILGANVMKLYKCIWLQDNSLPYPLSICISPIFWQPLTSSDSMRAVRLPCACSHQVCVLNLNDRPRCCWNVYVMSVFSKRFLNFVVRGCWKRMICRRFWWEKNENCEKHCETIVDNAFATIKSGCVFFRANPLFNPVHPPVWGVESFQRQHASPIANL